MTKRYFMRATNKQFNEVRKVGEFLIANVAWHWNKEWKIVVTVDFSEVSERKYIPINSFHTKEELWLFIKQSANLNKGSK